MKKLNKEPYVNDAIFKPTITRASFEDWKINAAPISMTVQKREIPLDVFRDFKFGNQSLTKEEERELIEELKVDIAADKTPAITIPFNPIGKILSIT